MAGYSAKGAYIAKAQACLLAAILLLAAGAGPAFGCGACGCTLNSDWASQGFATIPGFSLGLRQDTFNQDQLRSGTSAPSRSTFGFPNGQEVQRQTLNRNTTLALDYVAAKAWGLTLTVPACNRFHSTTAPGDTEPSWSQGTGLGDLRVMARYLGFLEDASLGIQLGLKLATGAMNQTFQGGPQAGTPLDRGVQLGTGTTDLLLGVTRSGAWSPEWKYSGQALLQHPLASREDFRPGDGLNANVGLRYEPGGAVIPSLQLNARAERRESGAQADVQNSGATLVYLSPGATLQATASLQAFAFLQVPILQRVNGLQLEFRASFSLGLHYSF